MFGWRRKRDGFEWHKYVRTTIKLRRENRKAKIDGARQAAVEGLSSAGRAGVATGSAGLVALWHGLVRFAAALLAAPARVLHVLSPVAAPALRELQNFLRRPGMRPLLLVIGSIAGAAGVMRWRSFGFDRDTTLVAVIAGLALLGVLLSVWNDKKIKLPRPIQKARDALARRLPVVGRLSPLAVLAGLGALGLAGLFAAAMTLSPGSMRLASFVPMPSLATVTIEGKASVVSGDALRVKDKVVQLVGIEAPDKEQRCTRGGKRWKCGEAAADGMSRILRGKTVRCEVGSADDGGRTGGSCSVDGKDIAATLVREGMVFAAGGLFSGYGAGEREARAQKAGIWAGEAERPSEYRAKLWEAAKKAAPDGCPIKGIVSGDGRTYVLPWSADYVRARVRTSKGERWFCSEAEARAAGWKLAARG